MIPSPHIEPDAAQLDAAHELLERLTAEHGLVRHGDEFGEVVADVAVGRSYFDVVAFEEAVQGQAGLAFQRGVSAASGACPGRPVGAASNVRQRAAEESRVASDGLDVSAALMGAGWEAMTPVVASTGPHPPGIVEGHLVR